MPNSFDVKVLTELTVSVTLDSHGISVGMRTPGSPPISPTKFSLADLIDAELEWYSVPTDRRTESKAYRDLEKLLANAQKHLEKRRKKVFGPIKGRTNA